LCGGEDAHRFADFRKRLFASAPCATRGHAAHDHPGRATWSHPSAREHPRCGWTHTRTTEACGTSGGRREPRDPQPRGQRRRLSDGRQIAAGRVERTDSIRFSHEYTDVWRDAQSPVTDDYRAGDNRFTGTIKWIEMEGGQDSHDHLVDPDQVFHCQMAKQ
jgi:hypothetical protein